MLESREKSETFPFTNSQNNCWEIWAILTVHNKVDKLRRDAAAKGLTHVNTRVTNSKIVEGQSSGLMVQLQSVFKMVFIVTPDHCVL